MSSFSGQPGLDWLTKTQQSFQFDGVTEPKHSEMVFYWVFSIPDGVIKCRASLGDVNRHSGVVEFGTKNPVDFVLS